MARESESRLIGRERRFRRGRADYTPSELGKEAQAYRCLDT